MPGVGWEPRMAALVAGLGATMLFLTRPAWQAPLLLGLAALLTSIWYTFWQPCIWLRLVFDIALFGPLWWVARWVTRASAVTWTVVNSLNCHTHIIGILEERR